MPYFLQLLTGNGHFFHFFAKFGDLNVVPSKFDKIFNAYQVLNIFIEYVHP
jgi:hypothetical protein